MIFGIKHGEDSERRTNKKHTDIPDERYDVSVFGIFSSLWLNGLVIVSVRKSSRLVLINIMVIVVLSARVSAVITDFSAVVAS
jgi:hypothetical protein